MKKSLKLMLLLGVLTAWCVLQSSFGGSSTDSGTCLNYEISKREIRKRIDMKYKVCHWIHDPFMYLKKSSGLLWTKEIYRVVFQIEKYQMEMKRN